MIYYILTLIIFSVLVLPSRTIYAVPPPDFVFNIGSQIVQIFSFIILGATIIIAALRRFFQTNTLFVRFGKIAWVVLGILVLGLALTGAYFYDQYRQDKAYEQWVRESQQQDISIQEEQAGEDDLDRLKLGESQGREILVRGVPPTDKGVAFIQEYYANLAAGRVAAAYAVSSKVVSLAIYESWYKNTTGLTVDSIQKISENKYSLGLTLYENTNATRYAVLMTLEPTADETLRIQHSDVRVLTQAESGQPTVEDGERETTAFFDQNQHLDLAISNEEFKKIVIQKKIIYVLDAREDEEYEIGYFPGSHHIRFADLKAGEWIRVPQDTIVYIFCWSGIRGKEVAEFLRSKKIVARYISVGADGWVDFGGTWTGDIKFVSRYSAERYTVVLTTDQVKEYQNQGVVIVDSRHPAKYKKGHIPGSVSIPIIYTPTSGMEVTLAQVPPGKAVLTVCDDFISCFDAKVTGIKLEKREHQFIGRYNKPWEY